MINEIIIRDAQIKDASAILKYVKQIGDETDFLSFAGDEFNKSLSEEELIIEQHRQAENQIFIVAEKDNQIVGLLNVNSSQKNRLKHRGEFGISVLKAHWGQGIASKLIQHMIHWAKYEARLKKLDLKVDENNEIAINLYKKFGFEMEGLVKRDMLINGRFTNSLIMGLMID